MLYKEIKTNAQSWKNILFTLSVLTKDKEVFVMLADDDEDDRDLFKEAMNEVMPHVKVQTVEDGERLIKMLEKPDARIPDLIFLDLNMPCKSGTECLKEIRKRNNLKHIPIIIYSTSGHTEDIDRTYYNGANVYVRKPRSFKGIQSVLQKLFYIDWDQYTPLANKEKFVFS